MTRWINLGYLRLGSRILLNLPAGLYSSGSGRLPGYILTGLGFTMKGFFSTDYFSFLPWIFLFWGGFFLNRALSAQGHGKAFAGLIALAREGAFKKDDNVLFIHTGGAGGLFAIDM